MFALPRAASTVPSQPFSLPKASILESVRHFLVRVTYFNSIPL